jgi:hypothetical protein
MQIGSRGKIEPRAKGKKGVYSIVGYRFYKKGGFPIREKGRHRRWRPTVNLMGKEIVKKTYRL